MPVIEEHIVLKRDQPQRLSDYVIGVFEAITTRKGMKKALRKGWVQRNKQQGFSGDFVEGGELLTLTIPDDHRPVYKRTIEVLYEDTYLAVVYKPAGILTNGSSFRTLENALPFNLKQTTLVDSIRPEPAHRLDYMTSGLMVCAKTRTVLSDLRFQFAQKSIKKTYHAVVAGAVPDEGSINTSIGDKDAQTYFKTIKRQHAGKHEALNLLELHLETGRTHQLRIHLSRIGFPIIGDLKYGGAHTVLKHGLFLTASVLSFTHPTTKEPLHFNRQLPKKFRRLFL